MDEPYDEARYSPAVSDLPVASAGREVVPPIWTFGVQLGSQLSANN